MYRHLKEKLVAWKNNENRKPLLLKGARQVGKTWLLKDFGENEYANCVYVNFEASPHLASVFDGGWDLGKIVLSLSVESGKVVSAVNTLIIFDEIQAAPQALASLKYFSEIAPEYHVVAAGSLLGVALHSHVSFPVGKVEFLELYPLNFLEFLEALNETGLVTILKSNQWDLINAFNDKLTSLLRLYYYIGGMPEAVQSFINQKNFNEIRMIQKRILQAYEYDFSKYPPVELVPRIRLVWNAIISQLAKENRKFIYGQVKKGSRAKEFEMAILWLCDSGLIYKVNRVNKSAIPLKAYLDSDAFKLFIVDIGLLNAMADLSADVLLYGNRIFEEFKGAATEQYVYQQLKTNEIDNVYYWSAENGTAEIDFLVQVDGNVVPIEVKAEENLRSKSLRLFVQKYSPGHALRFSMSGFRRQDWVTNVPLFAVNGIVEFIRNKS